MKLTTLRIRGNVLSARMSEYFHLAAFFLFHLFLAFFFLFCSSLLPLINGSSVSSLSVCAPGDTNVRVSTANSSAAAVSAYPNKSPLNFCLNYFVFSLFSIWSLLSCEVVHCTMYSIYIHLNSLPVCCDDENDEALRRD